MGTESHRVFSLKYRPSTFDELAGQPHVCQTLVNTLVRKQVGHGYIFSGPRGVGKTSAARLFAKALNCEKGPGPDICNKCTPCREIAGGNCLDVIEMDGASNRKIEDVRTLRENVRFAPTTCRRKIYIIDEVHMLTQEAFNALLKTLEEPPEHVVFILATTDPQKIPDTIHSRCQELEFHRLSVAQLEEMFRHVCKKEKIAADPESIRKMAEWADGSARDALVALEQAAAFSNGDISEENVDRLFGWVDRRTIAEILDSVMSEDRKAVFAAVRRIEDNGKDISHFMIQTAGVLRQAWLDRADGKTPSPESLAGCDADALLRMIAMLLESERNLRTSRQPGLYLSIKLAELIDIKHAVPVSRMVERLEALESRLAGQSPSAPKSAAPAAVMTRHPSPRDADPAVVWKKLKDAVGADDAQIQAWLREGRPVTCSAADKAFTIRFAAQFSLHHEKVTMEKARALLDARLSMVMGEPGWRLLAELEGKDAGSAPLAPGADARPSGRVRVAMEMFDGKAARHNG